VSRRRFKQTVVIQTPADTLDTNEYGDEDDTVDTAWVGVESAALVNETGSGEDEVDRETVMRVFELLLPPEASIDNRCRVIVPLPDDSELTCRVIGAPRLWVRAGGGASHISATLEAVEG
jgi:hypothetical protein